MTDCETFDSTETLRSIAPHGTQGDVRRDNGLADCCNSPVTRRIAISQAALRQCSASGVI